MRRTAHPRSCCRSCWDWVYVICKVLGSILRMKAFPKEANSIVGLPERGFQRLEQYNHETIEI